MTQPNVRETSIDHGLTPQVKLLAPGEVLLTHDRDATIRGIAQRATFVANESYRLGRENAASGIYFADMTIETASGHETSQPVAIKPLERDWLVTEEIRRAHELNQLSSKKRPNVSGSPITFAALGAYHDPEFGPAAITRFEQGVESFDNLFSHDDTPSAHLERCFALTNAAETLLFLHANGFIHRDIQVKNTAYDSTGARIIDISSVEKTRLFNKTDLDKRVGDLTYYIRSLNYMGDPTAASGADVDEHFIDFYAQQVDTIYPRELQFPARLALEAIDADRLMSEGFVYQ